MNTCSFVNPCSIVKYVSFSICNICFIYILFYLYYMICLFQKRLNVPKILLGLKVLFIPCTNHFVLPFEKKL